MGGDSFRGFEAMSAPRGLRLRSSRAGARLVLGAILGELLGALVGLVVAPKRHVGATVVEIAKPSYGTASDTSDTEESDPLVAWPLLGAVAGVLVGVGAVRAYEEFQRVCGRSVEGRHQPHSAVTSR